MPWSKLSRQARGYGSAWIRLRKQVIERDSHLCQRCMRAGRITEGREVHHVVPKARGGSDALSNLELVCPTCHLEADAEINNKTLKPQIAFDDRGYPMPAQDPRGGKMEIRSESPKNRAPVSEARPHLKVFKR